MIVLLSEEVPMGENLPGWNLAGILALISVDQALHCNAFYLQVFLQQLLISFLYVEDKMCYAFLLLFIRHLNFIPGGLLFLHEKQLGLLIFFKDTYSTFCLHSFGV